MEPRHAGLNGGIEQKAPQGEGSFDAPRFEQHPSSVETLSNQAEKTPHTEAASQPQPAAVLPSMPAPLVPQQDAGQSTASDDIATLAAADEDLIEKEWVDKAKKIISETKDDPYRREREVSKLQIEYIRKRYGREIGEAGGR